MQFTKWWQSGGSRDTRRRGILIGPKGCDQCHLTTKMSDRDQTPVELRTRHVVRRLFVVRISAANSRTSDRCVHPMSMNEYSTIMREAGLTGGDSLRVEHVLTLRFDDQWQPSLEKLAHAALDATRSLVTGCKVLVYAVSAFLVLYGSSKLIEAYKAPNKRSQ